jgi:hypothetical protein
LGIIAAVLGGLGLIFLTIGLLRRRMLRGWVRASGQVIPRGALSRAGLPARFPTFAWQDQHGVVHSRTSNVRSSFSPAPGTVVPVLYDPTAPHRGVLDTFAQRGSAFTLIGALILVIGVLMAALALSAG